MDIDATDPPTPRSSGRKRQPTWKAQAQVPVFEENGTEERNRTPTRRNSSIQIQIPSTHLPLLPIRPWPALLQPHRPHISQDREDEMSENTAPSTSTTAAGDVPGQPYYEKTRRHLQELLRKKALIANNLANLEDQIYKKETEYLEETPSGNIITGFENYTKGTSTGLGGRKRGNVVEGNRVFSKSSVGFGIGGVSALLPIASAS